MKKNQAIVLGACLVGGFVAYQMLKKTRPGVGDDLLLPPPGRTVTASGQVLGDLGEDVFSAGPSQYRRDAVNDFVPDVAGLGGGWKKKFKKAFKPPKFVSRIVAATNRVNPLVQGAHLLQNVAKITVKAVSNPRKGFKSLGFAVKSMTTRPLKQIGMAVGIIKPPKQKVAPGGAAEYQDADGKVISKEDYDKLVLASQQSIPKKAEDYKGYAISTIIKDSAGGSVVYLINYDPEKNECEGAYDTMAEAKAAIDAVMQPAAATAPPTTHQAAQNRYSAEQAAAEQASISAASDSSGYGTTSTSTSTSTSGSSAPPTTHQAAKNRYSAEQAAAEQASISEAREGGYDTPSKGPALPERITEIQTPSAQVLPEEAPAEPVSETKKGNTAVGVVVGGGILAAVAAALMNR